MPHKDGFVNNCVADGDGVTGIDLPLKYENQPTGTGDEAIAMARRKDLTCAWAGAQRSDCHTRPYMPYQLICHMKSLGRWQERSATANIHCVHLCTVACFLEGLDKSVSMHCLSELIILNWDAWPEGCIPMYRLDIKTGKMHQSQIASKVRPRKPIHTMANFLCNMLSFCYHHMLIFLYPDNIRCQTWCMYRKIKAWA